MARLRALVAADEGAAGRRLDRLALAADGVDAHLQRILTAAAAVREPVPHLIVREALPAPFYAVLLDLIPPRIFFDEAGKDLLTMRVPPSLAPVDVLAAWRLIDDLARRVVAPAVVARARQVMGSGWAPGLGSGGRLVSHVRLVRRGPLSDGRDVRRPVHDALRVVLWLARPGDPETGGARLVDAHGQGPGADVAYRANMAVVTVGGEAWAYQAVPRGAPAGADADRISFEFSIGAARPGAADARQGAPNRRSP